MVVHLKPLEYFIQILKEFGDIIDKYVFDPIFLTSVKDQIYHT